MTLRFASHQVNHHGEPDLHYTELPLLFSSKCADRNNLSHLNRMLFGLQ